METKSGVREGTERALDLAVDNPENEGTATHVTRDSQTASDFIRTQLQLEADAREALPYAFDRCTAPLGPLRQPIFSCLTCSPPPVNPSDPYTPAGVCYSCSIACHGEHTLVELFHRRNFVCDCGTTRLPSTSPCTLRINSNTGQKGGVHGEAPAEGNTYNQNFANRFCGCGEVYDAHKEKGTMFQCLGLATENHGGCGEDWWHPECVVGLGRVWSEKINGRAKAEERIVNEATDANDEDEEEKPTPLPPGFPEEDAFDTFICYQCVEVNPWIKRYADTPGFLPPVYHELPTDSLIAKADSHINQLNDIASSKPLETSHIQTQVPNKRNAEDSPESHTKRQRISVQVSETILSSSLQPLVEATSQPPPSTCTFTTLPASPTRPLSLFLQEDFRAHLCCCSSCYPILSAHPQLLEDEDIYEPPVSEDGDGQASVGTGTGSLLERGEAALSNVDRVRAIEGVMAYNHLKSRVKSFLQPFAESGTAVGAEDIKAYFEKLRGDDEAIRLAAMTGSGGGMGGDARREQGDTTLPEECRPGSRNAIQGHLDGPTSSIAGFNADLRKKYDGKLNASARAGRHHGIWRKVRWALSAADDLKEFWIGLSRQLETMKLLTIPEMEGDTTTIGSKVTAIQLSSNAIEKQLPLLLSSVANVDSKAVASQQPLRDIKQQLSLVLSAIYQSRIPFEPSPNVKRDCCQTNRFHLQDPGATTREIATGRKARYRGLQDQEDKAMDVVTDFVGKVPSLSLQVGDVSSAIQDRQETDTLLRELHALRNNLKNKGIDSQKMSD